MNAFSFFKEGIRNLKTVGTLTRSSRFLSRGMIRHVDFSSAKVLVELGAGDGVITKHILNQMSPDACLYAFEVLPIMCKHLREIEDDRLIVVEDSAENIGQYLKQNEHTHADFILSAIPFVALPKELGFRIVEQCKKHLVDGGKYMQVHYSLLAKDLYQKIFGNVAIHFVLFNLPPAFVLVSEKTK
jgi:phospholipid N-methyltransferase